MNFLIERTKNSKSPLHLKSLAEEFKEKSGSSHEIPFLVSRISNFRPNIHQMKSIDMETKVKMLFALSAPVDGNFLIELRKDAFVGVDRLIRIKWYRAKDGSLELKGDHSISAKIEGGLKQIKMVNQDDSDDGSRNSDDESQESDDESQNSDDGSQESDDPQNLPHKTPGSLKRAAPEVSIFSKKTKGSSSDDSVKIPESRATELVRASPPPPNPKVQELLQPRKQSNMENQKRRQDSGDGSVNPIPKTPGSVKRSAVEVPNPSKKAKNSSPVHSMKSKDRAPEDSSRQLLEPKVEDDLEAPGTRTDEEAPIKTEPEADDGFTPRIKFLEAIRFLILNLDTPTLSVLQARIEKKLRTFSSNAKIPNNEMIPAMEMLFAKITNYSVSNLSENVESIGLKEFLCYLKAAILNSELEGLKALLEKIKEKIKEPISNDKSIPVEKVATALHSILKVTGF